MFTATYYTCTGLNIITAPDIFPMLHLGQGGTGICSECSPSYIGANCDLSIPLVVVPTLLAVSAVVTVCIILSIWYIRR